MQNLMFSLDQAYSLYFNVFDILLFSAFPVNNQESSMEVYFDSAFVTFSLGVLSISSLCILRLFY